MASAMPMKSFVYRLPVGPSTTAPLSSARPASGIPLGHHDIARSGVLDDPVIGGVGAVRHQHVDDHGVARWPQPEIGDKRHLYTVPSRRAQHLVLDRTGIGINENLRAHRRTLPDHPPHGSRILGRVAGSSPAMTTEGIMPRQEPGLVLPSSVMAGRRPRPPSEVLGRPRKPSATHRLSSQQAGTQVAPRAGRWMGPSFRWSDTE